jgi:uncharacterized Zn-binding protein involved in type VI secretion
MNLLQCAFLRIGDKTTSGGMVIQGFSNVRHDGLELTYIGANVYCAESAPSAAKISHFRLRKGHEEGSGTVRIFNEYGRRGARVQVKLVR